MKRKTVLGLCLSIVLLLMGCSTGMPSAKQESEDTSEKNESKDAGENAYHKITAEEAKDKMDEGNVTVVDVRTAEEYSDCRIPGAILIPNESIDTEPPQELPDKDAAVLLYCRSGNRSRQAADKLIDMGYTNVYDFGGIMDWPYETDGGTST